MNVGQAVIVVGAFDGPRGRMPGVAYLPQNIEKIQSLRFRIVGGPNQQVAEFGSAEHDLDIRNVSRGIATIRPAYLGTYLRSLHPQSSVEPAAVELSAYYEWLRTRFASKPMTVMADSAGSVVFAKMTGTARSGPVVLLAPIMKTPRASLSAILSQKDPYGLHRSYQLVRAYKWDGQNLLFVQAHSFPGQEIFRAFFGDHMDMEVADEIGRVRSICPVLIYGSDDDRAGVQWADAFAARVGAKHVWKIDGMGHSTISPKQMATIDDSITKSLKNCRSPSVSNAS